MVSACRSKGGSNSARLDRQNFFRQVYDLVAQIPLGMVATYGQIATLLGHPQAARTVGWALHMLPEDTDVPWQRVINSAGRISIPDPEMAHEQRARLVEEGIVFDERGYTDLRKYLWDGPPRLRKSREILQAGGIIFWNGDVVLRKTAKGEFVFPKGHIESGESAEEAALREVKEETGLICRVLFDAGEVSFELGGELYQVILYAMEVVQKTLAWRNHEGRDAFRLSQTEAQKSLIFLDSRRVLRETLRRFCLPRPGKKQK